MDSLAKILEKIEKENNEACEKVIADAKQRADEIISSAQKNSKEYKALKMAETEKEFSNKIAMANSSAELLKNRRTLAAKIEIINGCMEQAIKYLNNLPNDDYFKILEDLAVGHAENAAGVLKVSESDFKRLPESFEADINKRLENGAEISVESDANVNGGGFILCYDEVVQNCTFSALLEDCLDEVKDELSKILFV